MPLENRNQVLIIIGAVIAGVFAVVFMSNYITTKITTQTKILADDFSAKQEKMAAENDARQKELVTQIQQKTEQQMASLAQQIEQVKTEQAQAIQKQMAAAQQDAPVKKRKQSIALKTPVGKRAVTIMIDSLAAVGGLLNAGDYVDVIAQLNVPSQATDKKTVTAMVFQGVQVLAVNTNVDDPGAYDDQQAASSLKITVAVDPEEASLLSFANKNGNLELALRSPQDTDHQKVKASTWKTLADYVLKNQGLDIQDPDGDNANKQEDNKPEIEIIRGGRQL